MTHTLTYIVFQAFLSHPSFRSQISLRSKPRYLLNSTPEENAKCCQRTKTSAQFLHIDLHTLTMQYYMQYNNDQDSAPRQYNFSSLQAASSIYLFTASDSRLKYPRRRLCAHDVNERFRNHLFQASSNPKSRLAKAPSHTSHIATPPA